MNRRTILKAGGAGTALLVSAPYVSLRAAPLTMRFAHFGAEDHPSNLAAKQFVERVASRTNGEIKINIFPNNVLGGPPEQAQQIKLGTIDMGLPTQGQLDKYDTAFAAVMLPFIWDSPQHAFRVLDGPAMAWLAPLAEKQGFILLRNWEYGFRNVTNNVRPINAPGDVKGLKLRTPPELQIQASMEALGATVQAIAFPELYLALSQKVVDGEENPIAVIYFNKFYEVQKHLAITRHIYNNMIHTVSAATWTRLTPGQQAIFREESASAGELMRKLIADQEDDQIKRIEAAGMAVTRPDLAPFRALMGPAYERIAAYAGADNVKKFREMADQGRTG
ncbi:MAG TPA: TRAP transporter substrate-binding protein [Hyphomicrobiaceae bacterium]|nr:TRAP transporter substrate-binding protein [Hyphomicrobiaceae bacterium]